MAKFKSIYGQISGKLGGSIFSSNKGGSYIKAFKVPTNPATAKQSAVRNKLSNVAKAWQALTEDVKNRYRSWAEDHPVLDRLGESIYISGFAWYQKLAFNSLNVGGTLSGLEAPEEHEFTIVSAEVTDNDLLTDVEITLTDAVPSDEAVIIRAQVFESAGIKNPGRLKQIKVVPPSAAAVVSIKTELQNTFGTLEAGQRVFVSILPIFKATGNAGTEFKLEPFTLIDTTS